MDTFTSNINLKTLQSVNGDYNRNIIIMIVVGRGVELQNNSHSDLYIWGGSSSVYTGFLVLWLPAEVQ